ADRRYHHLLDVVPLDVVDAAGDPDAVVDVVLGADLETVDGVGVVGRRRVRYAEIREVRRTGGERQRVVGTAGTVALRVGRVDHVIRVGLVLQGQLRGERVL